ncbi:hypothetical protein Scep_031057 [Stephania cephalantha]|uniref:Uncharacterized protein n=1 Tax=Stephania cephalantha TaxID=152367 RepID=A0AAP0DYL5_9MAGN
MNKNPNEDEIRPNAIDFKLKNHFSANQLRNAFVECSISVLDLLCENVQFA